MVDQACLDRDKRDRFKAQEADVAEIIGEGLPLDHHHVLDADAESAVLVVAGLVRDLFFLNTNFNFERERERRDLAYRH